VLFSGAISVLQHSEAGAISFPLAV
jgi:hypothetical protein